MSDHQERLSEKQRAVADVRNWTARQILTYFTLIQKPSKYFRHFFEAEESKMN